MNDISARDQRRGGQWFFSKGQDSYAPFGPGGAHRRRDPRPAVARPRTEGQRRGEAEGQHPAHALRRRHPHRRHLLRASPSSRAMSSPPARPQGVGAAQNPPQFLQPGDVVEATVERIGTLRNPRGGRAMSATASGRSCPARTSPWRPRSPRCSGRARRSPRSGSPSTPRRMRMQHVTPEALAAMDAESDRCAVELADARVDVLGYACLVAIMAMGPGYHRTAEARLAKRAADAGGPAPVVTSAGALLAGLQILEAPAGRDHHAVPAAAHPGRRGLPRGRGCAGARLRRARRRGQPRGRRAGPAQPDRHRPRARPTGRRRGRAVRLRADAVAGGGGRGRGGVGQAGRLRRDRHGPSVDAGDGAAGARTRCGVGCWAATTRWPACRTPWPSDDDRERADRFRDSPFAARSNGSTPTLPATIITAPSSAGSKPPRPNCSSRSGSRACSAGSRACTTRSTTAARLWFGQDVDIEIAIVRVGEKSVRYEFEVRADDIVAATGNLVITMAAPD